MSYTRLFYVQLTNRHFRPGRVARSVTDASGQKFEVPYPAALSIEKIEPDDDEVMLRLLDESGAELTHDHSFSLEQAFEDARYEFGIERNEWIPVIPGYKSA